MSLTKANDHVKSKAKNLFLCAANFCCLIEENLHRKHWTLDDPEKIQGSEEEIIAEFRRVRNDVKRNITELFNNLELSLAP